MATVPREFSFDLECRVMHKPMPLHLNVKAGGYATQMGLFFKNTRDDEIELPVEAEANQEINFGQVKRA